MKKAEHRKQVYDKMRDLLIFDKATTNVLPLSKFNLMQITRQRVRPQVVISTKENCPTCGGSGKIEASLLLMDLIDNKIEYLMNNKIKFALIVHPFIESFIKRGLISLQVKWFIEYRRWIKVRADENIALTDFKFENILGNPIDLSV